MTKYDFDIGVLGGGAAGLTVTAGSARLGARCLLVEKENELGGDCLHYGCVPSKTLIRTANIYHKLKNAKKYGLPEIQVRPVDYRDIVKRIQSVISIIQEHDSVERFSRLGARVEFGRPSFIDEHCIRLNGAVYSAKKWVIATGTSPAIPPVEGLKNTPYITNREIFSLEHLPASMIIFGAGPVAIEMAQAFSRLGTAVSVVQRSNQILSREDKDMADILMEALRSDGVDFYLNTKVVSVKDMGGRKEIVVQTGEQKAVLSAEVILVAAGREANLGGAGLREIGLEFDRKGLKVDARLRTSQRHIYAAGDVTGAFQFTHAAEYEAGIVISNAIFHLPRKTDYTYLPWCTYTEPEFAHIGMNEKQATAAGIEYTVWTEEFSDNDRSLAEGESVGKLKMLLNRKERPIGVQILGLHAGELISEWVAVMNGKVRMSTLAGAVHPYPTLGEINKRAAGKLLATKIFSERVRRLLKFFFNLKGRACD